MGMGCQNCPTLLFHFSFSSGLYKPAKLTAALANARSILVLRINISLYEYSTGKKC